MCEVCTKSTSFYVRDWSVPRTLEAMWQGWGNAGVWTPTVTVWDSHSDWQSQVAFRSCTSPGQSMQPAPRVVGGSRYLSGERVLWSAGSKGKGSFLIIWLMLCAPQGSSVTEPDLPSLNCKLQTPLGSDAITKYGRPQSTYFPDLTLIFSCNPEHSSSDQTWP